VKIEVPGRDVYAYSVHLDDSPYQPYQLLGIKYGDAPFIHTERQAIRFARRTRGPAIDLINRDLEQAQGADAAFIFGDFNEPSAHDWTSAAVAAGQQPLAVALRSPASAATVQF
jgi:exodeoxyribonuclease-3